MIPEQETLVLLAAITAVTLVILNRNARLAGFYASVHQHAEAQRNIGHDNPPVSGPPRRKDAKASISYYLARQVPEKKLADAGLTMKQGGAAHATVADEEGLPSMLPIEAYHEQKAMYQKLRKTPPKPNFSGNMTPSDFHPDAVHLPWVFARYAAST